MSSETGCKKRQLTCKDKRMTVLVVGTGYRAQAITETFLNQKCKIILVPKIPELVPRYILLEESRGCDPIYTEQSLPKNCLRIQARRPPTNMCNFKTSETESPTTAVKKRRSTSFTNKLIDKFAFKKHRNNDSKRHRLFTQKSDLNQPDPSTTTRQLNDEIRNNNVTVADVPSERSTNVMNQMFAQFTWKENEKETQDDRAIYFRERHALRSAFLSYVTIADTFEEIDQAIRTVLKSGGSIPLIFLACECQFVMSLHGLKMVKKINESLTKSSKGTYTIYCFYRQTPNMLLRLEEIGVHCDNVAIVTTFHDLKLLPKNVGTGLKVTNYWYGYKRPLYLFPKCGTSSSKYRFNVAMRNYEQVFGTRLDVQPENYNEEFNSLSIRSKFGRAGISCLKKGFPSLFSASDPDICMSLYLGNNSTPDHLNEFLAPFYVGLQLLRTDKHNKSYEPDEQYKEGLEMNRHELIGRAIKEILSQRSYFDNINGFWNSERTKGFEDWFRERASGIFSQGLQGKDIFEDLYVSFEHRYVLREIIRAAERNGRNMDACRRLLLATKAMYLNSCVELIQNDIVITST